MHTGLTIGNSAGDHINGALALFYHLLGLHCTQRGDLVAVFGGFFKLQISWRQTPYPALAA